MENVYTVIWLAACLFMLVSMWKVFTKAGKPGWASIIPIYNSIVMIQIAGKPVWWIILLLIPIVNIIVSAIVCIGIAENFGKGAGFGIGLLLVGMIFYPILAFGDAKYLSAGPAVAPAPPPPPVQ